jgi:hypothetical protein
METCTKVLSKSLKGEVSEDSMGTASMNFSVEMLLAFRTTPNLEDRSFLSGYFPLGRLPSLRLRSPGYSPVSLGRDPNPGTTRIILEQVSHLKYLGSDISYENNKDTDEKVAKFRHICGLIHRNLKNKTRRDTRTKFHKTTAVAT